jgi:hypothetical protein
MYLWPTYSWRNLISARILISASDFYSQKVHLEINIYKNFLWNVKIQYFVNVNQDKKFWNIYF